MLGTILGISIPILYIVIAACVARYVTKHVGQEVTTTVWDKSSANNDDKVFAAAIVGIFWPVAFPLFFAINSAL